MRWGWIRNLGTIGCTKGAIQTLYCLGRHTNHKSKWSWDRVYDIKGRIAMTVSRIAWIRVTILLKKINKFKYKDTYMSLYKSEWIFHSSNLYNHIIIWLKGEIAHKQGLLRDRVSNIVFFKKKGIRTCTEACHQLLVFVIQCCRYKKVLPEYQCQCEVPDVRWKHS